MDIHGEAKVHRSIVIPINNERRTIIDEYRCELLSFFVPLG